MICAWQFDADVALRAQLAAVAAWLRVRIEAGEFQPGEDPLPSEKGLIQLFGVARDTARRACSFCGMRASSSPSPSAGPTSPGAADARREAHLGHTTPANDG
jgi:hypothetical protein